MRGRLPSISDSDAKELKRKVEELEAEKERKLEYRVTVLEGTVSEIKDIVTSAKAAMRAYLFAFTAFWTLIVAAGGIALKIWVGH